MLPYKTHILLSVKLIIQSLQPYHHFESYVRVMTKVTFILRHINNQISNLMNMKYVIWKWETKLKVQYLWI